MGLYNAIYQQHDEAGEFFQAVVGSGVRACSRPRGCLAVQSVDGRHIHSGLPCVLLRKCRLFGDLVEEE
jgi:hypothetical protein